MTDHPPVSATLRRIAGALALAAFYLLLADRVAPAETAAAVAAGIAGAAAALALLPRRERGRAAGVAAGLAVLPAILRESAIVLAALARAARTRSEPPGSWRRVALERTEEAILRSIPPNSYVVDLEEGRPLMHHLTRSAGACHTGSGQ